MLFGFWHCGDHQSLSGFTATTPNYVLDHLSVDAAQAVADYWDRQVLTDRSRELIRQIGAGSVFEDSLELSSTMKWTPSFARDFEKYRGYSVLRYLPAVAGAGEAGNGKPSFDFPDGIGARIREDYRQSWSDLYLNNRVRTLQKWLHGQGRTLRAQPYGNAIDAPYVASQLDIPEGESLGFGNILLSTNVEKHKLLAAGAHMSGRTVVSMECCAYLALPYGTTAGQNLQEIYRAYAGGVTQQVWSGFPYADLDGATWPGWDGFAFPLVFAENWGPRQPTWQHYRSINDHLGRLQLVLRQGRPRFDVAVYWRSFDIPQLEDGINIPTASALARDGYTYEYLSPAIFREPYAVYDGSRLFPQKSSYKALILRQESVIPLDTARRFVSYARRGLPIVIVGTLPSRTPGYYKAAEEDAGVQAAMQELQGLPNVVTVANDDAIPGALATLGVEPSVRRDQDSGLLSLRRQTEDTDYYYLFNYTRALAAGVDLPLSGADADLEAALEGEGRPYELDAWSGAIRPIAGYRRDGGRIVLPLQLRKGDVRVIAISRRSLDGGPRPGASAVAGPGAELLYRGGQLVLRSSQPGEHTLSLADGTSGGATIAAVPAPILLDRWQLKADAWEPGASATETRIVSHQVTVNALPGGMLPGWLLLPGLTIASGQGRYSTTVNLGPAWSGGHGAWLDLGSVLDTAAVTVNGQRLPPINLLDPSRIDLGPYLQPGDNSIVVDIATTLGNRVRISRLTNPYIASGLYGGVLPQNYGLLGPVRLMPYGEAVVTVPGA
ncbi:glycosyl hydrolase [Solimonas sp. K1W22B-7]|uniref:glycosyl hydrolase n=1 Tax=Solimonas sp. K1W22B-7 TaxID=2303331 RepID=UPI0013C415D7|nr:glycosyl hydrolase [Solimonas sp. K1W22B-7]